MKSNDKAEKTCTKCKVTQSEDNFYKAGHAYPKTICKKCSSAYTREYNRRRAEERKAYSPI